jgi:hypothetical protein
MRRDRQELFRKNCFMDASFPDTTGRISCITLCSLPFCSFLFRHSYQVKCWWTRGSNHGGGNIYIFSETSRPVLGLTHPPIQWTTRALPPELQWRGREFNRSPSPSVKVKDSEDTPLLSQQNFMVCNRDSFTLTIGRW